MNPILSLGVVRQNLDLFFSLATRPQRLSIEECTAAVSACDQLIHRIRVLRIGVIDNNGYTDDGYNMETSTIKLVAAAPPVAA